MHRYLILADGFVALNHQTMQLIEQDKAAGWRVADVVTVLLEPMLNNHYQETQNPAGIVAAKIVLT